jgi:uncharacterized protein (TIGR03435 family)
VQHRRRHWTDLLRWLPDHASHAHVRERGGTPVVDPTGLTGNWQFLLTFAPERSTNFPADANSPAADPDAPNFFTAIQEQLGLKLESTKAPFDITVIDSAEHPTED